MFNKLELNNQITSLKGEVQKTRAQVIQRLIKRITFLKQKVDANPKLANKVEVIAKEIKILKVAFLVIFVKVEARLNQFFLSRNFNFVTW